MQITKSLTLFRARLLLEEGRSKEALGVLQDVDTQDEDVQDEVAYLQGWSYIENRRWNEAAQVLSPFLIEAWREDPNVEPLPDRERRIAYLLRLGQAAVRIARYDDAREHLSLCIKLLRDRRVSLPLTRIRAHAALAMTYGMKTLIKQAIEEYEVALRLCVEHKEYQDEELPGIYYGLCDAYRLAGDFEAAKDFGERALKSYQRLGYQDFESRMHNLLGLICAQLTNEDSADAHYKASLELAQRNEQQVMVMLNYAGLAELRLQQRMIDKAKKYCKQALSEAKISQDYHMSGGVYVSVAKVMIAIANDCVEEVKHQMYEEVIPLFQNAEKLLIETQAYLDLTEMYGLWAETLEVLHRGKEAIKYWRESFLMNGRLTAQDFCSLRTSY